MPFFIWDGMRTGNWQVGRIPLKPPVQVAIDGTVTGTALATAPLFNRPYSENERKAINRMLPATLAKAAGARTGPLPPSLAGRWISPTGAYLIPAGLAIRNAVEATDAIGAVRPGLLTDPAGHGRYVKSMSDYWQSVVWGPLLKDTESRWRVRDMREATAARTAARQRVIGTLLEGDQPGAQKLIAEWRQAFPHSPLFADVQDVTETLVKEKERRASTDEETAFKALDKGAAITRAQLAQRRLRDPALTDAERETEKRILALAQKRFSK
jgi:hypothetical protein